MLEKNLSKTDRISKEQAEKIMKLDVEIGLRETNIHDKTYELD